MKPSRGSEDHGFPRVVAALALCLTLAACADYRTADLKRDVIPAEQIARDYRLNPEWWTAYGDADLDALMRTALARNVNLARSAVAVNRALYNARLIGADLLPIFRRTLRPVPTRTLPQATPAAPTSHASA